MRGDDGRLLTDASYDSRAVAPGSLFFCIPGDQEDGHRFAPAALAAGAGAIVVERWLELDAPQALVPSVREAIGPMSSVIFGRPAEALTTIGITGTNGKTTTTYLLEAIIRAAGSRAGVIGTNGARIDGDPVELARTTPEAPGPASAARADAFEAGVQAVAMEVSSHALAQHRVDGIVFDVAVFTNLSQDHLDYHGTMESYFGGQGRPLHAGACRPGAPERRRSLRAPAPAAHRDPRRRRIGVERDADLRASDVAVDARGTSFHVDGVEVRSALLGRFNVSNCLAAMAAAREVGIPLEAACAAGSGRCASPRPDGAGRAGQDFLVVVDYAHTPDSIRVVLRARTLAGRRPRDRRVRLRRRPRPGEACPSWGRRRTSSADLTRDHQRQPSIRGPARDHRGDRAGRGRGRGDYVVEPDRRARDPARPAGGEAGRHRRDRRQGPRDRARRSAGPSSPFDDRVGRRGTSSRSLLEGA